MQCNAMQCTHSNCTVLHCCITAHGIMPTLQRMLLLPLQHSVRASLLPPAVHPVASPRHTDADNACVHPYHPPTMLLLLLLCDATPVADTYPNQVAGHCTQCWSTSPKCGQYTALRTSDFALRTL